jgi:hypothetical protein
LKNRYLFAKGPKESTTDESLKSQSNENTPEIKRDKKHFCERMKEREEYKLTCLKQEPKESERQQDQMRKFEIHNRPRTLKIHTQGYKFGTKGEVTAHSCECNIHSRNRKFFPVLLRQRGSFHYLLDEISIHKTTVKLTSSQFEIEERNYPSQRDLLSQKITYEQSEN